MALLLAASILAGCGAGPGGGRMGAVGPSATGPGAGGVHPIAPQPAVPASPQRTGIVRLVATRRAVAGPGLRIPVVMYHVIAAAPRSSYGYLYVTRQRFARQMAALRAAGYCAITLDAAHALWAASAHLPGCRPLLVRFDDGYASVFSQAFPVLRRMGWPANLCQQVQRINLPGGLAAGQIRALLASGWELADHGYYQPELSLVGASPAQLLRQVVISRQLLTAQFGGAVHYYCWPLGYYDARAIRAVRAAGFWGGLAVGIGAAQPAVQGRWRLDAIPVWGSLTTRSLVAEVRRLQSSPAAVPPPATRR